MTKEPGGDGRTRNGGRGAGVERRRRTPGSLGGSYLQRMLAGRRRRGNAAAIGLLTKWVTWGPRLDLVELGVRAVRAWRWLRSEVPAVFRRRAAAAEAEVFDAVNEALIELGRHAHRELPDRYDPEFERMLWEGLEEEADQAIRTLARAGVTAAEAAAALQELADALREAELEFPPDGGDDAGGD